MKKQSTNTRIQQTNKEMVSIKNEPCSWDDTLNIFNSIPEN